MSYQNSFNPFPAKLLLQCLVIKGLKEYAVYRRSNGLYICILIVLFHINAVYKKLYLLHWKRALLLHCMAQHTLLGSSIRYTYTHAVTQVYTHNYCCEPFVWAYSIPSKAGQFDCNCVCVITGLEHFLSQDNNINTICASTISALYKGQYTLIYTHTAIWIHTYTNNMHTFRHSLCYVLYNHSMQVYIHSIHAYTVAVTAFLWLKLIKALCTKHRAPCQVGQGERERST